MNDLSLFLDLFPSPWKYFKANSLSLFSSLWSTQPSHELDTLRGAPRKRMSPTITLPATSSTRAKALL